MDPNIMKFLEEDEDETLHSGADVEAFTAELNRDIEGNSSIPQQPSDSGSASQGTISFQQWQASKNEGLLNYQSQQDLTITKQKDQLPLKPKVEDSSSQEFNAFTFSQNPSSDSTSDQQDGQKTFSVSQQSMVMQMDVKQPVVDQKPNINSEPQMQKLQNLSNQQSMGSNNQQGMSSQSLMTSGMSNQQQPMMGTSSQPGASLKLNRQVPFGVLLPIIQPQLDKDRAMQLQSLYLKLKKNEVTKDDFVRHMRSIVGDQMLKMAVYKLQTRNENQTPRNAQAGQGQLQPQQQQQPPVRQMQASSDLTNPASDSHTVKSREVENQVGSQGMQASFPAYGGAGSTYSHFTATNVASLSSFRPQLHDSQMRHAQAHQNMTSSHLGPTPRPMSITGMNLQPGTLTHINSMQQNQGQWASSTSNEQKFGGSSSMNYVKQEQGDQPKEMSRMGFTPPAAMTPIRSITASMANAKTPAKKPVVGQKKPMEAPGSSPPSKKQKASGGFSDQSIEHLNDVTAVSGVNLREEEEQLFSGSKEDSRAMEASRRVVQEEEEKLILHKLPLQNKVLEIMAKSGLKNMNSDVQKCLSLCVEERMRGLITNLIRLSKQRVDIEKPRHRTIITSDIRQQIMKINRKARDEWEKTQAETARSQNPIDSENGAGVDGDKDESRARATKANKEEDDKMRTTAANVAVRAATGVGDMLSRWQLMIEAKQKTGGNDTPSSSQVKDVTSKSLPTSTGNTKEGQGAEKRKNISGSRKARRNQVVPRIARSITAKDVIAILEREPQMAKSTLIYRLYDKINSNAAAPE